ncbi:transcription-repair coupling factor [Turicibacter sp. TJ11]|uniref:transcription-repair coupling factor n=1 Tax=Turicibacter sp. TJ11 TaxID=2806443 RepID=UPI001F29FA33|nr:transcription-repair coupling factor [Turicibacter sp. TJ11]
MNVMNKYISKSEQLQTLMTALMKENQNVLLSGVRTSFYAPLFQMMFENQQRPIIIMMQNLYHAQRLYDQLIDLMDDQFIRLFPMDEFITAEMLASSSELRTERMSTLTSIINNPNQIVITHVAGATRFLTPKEIFKQADIKIEVGSIYELEELKRKLVELGYQSVRMVEQMGEFSVRGGILDIFPMTEENPLRIEFFDDEIDTIRYFSPDTQRSINKVDSFIISPTFELVYSEEQVNLFEKRIKERLSRTVHLLDDETREELYAKIYQDIEKIKNHQDLEIMHKYISLLYDEPNTLLSYLDDPLVIYIDYNRILENQEHMNEDALSWQESAIESGKTIVDLNLYRPITEISASRQLFLLEHTSSLKDIELTEHIKLMTKSVSEFHGQLEFFAKECKRLKENNTTVFVAVSSMEARNNLANYLEELGITVVFPTSVEEVREGSIHLIYERLPLGFELLDPRIVVYTDYEIHTKRKKPTSYKSNFKEGKKIKDYNELKIGDYVVHVQHGIGQYIGIETLETNGALKDFIMIAYRGGDKLYVPIDKIEMVQKYVGSEGATPKIHKLGTSEWEKTKAKVKKTVKDIADKLIKIYAKREHLPGYAFSKDTIAQQAFENAFPYVETEDQLKAVAEIKADMEQPHPMDRLLIGDVGYGKTEVAMRAAFKAVQDGKQVAYLAPTTILSKQHYESFVARFKDFDVKIGLLNRYVSIKEQQELLTNIKNGKINIVVGTHRILSKDVVFNDLGILIIDEEQRFGVEHKEKIKEFKTEVDVLTLTATPIPRTLQMSMIGIRSLSLIETPPMNRYPVQTYVLEEHDGVIRDAIERELARDGQVFYLYNRVSDIEKRAAKIQKLVPDAVVEYAHGQMSKEQLEQTMADFEEKKFNVLVCTTIIETGIDIPNANTLIISDSYRLGLSQLYQLRGRVGRSDRIAYAYCMYPRNKVLTENAEKRLQTIKEFTELGSGFKIAMRDLAIRGAGDMLGAQQYGFIDTVGLDLYTQLLSEAVVHAREGSDFEVASFELPKLEFDFPTKVDAYIPDFYISDESTKIEIYQKIKKVTNDEEYNDIIDELIDRFGDFPDDVKYLIDLTFLKNITESYIQKTKSTNNSIEFILKEDITQDIDGQKLFEAVHKIGSMIRLAYKDNCINIIFDLPVVKRLQWFEYALELFKNFERFKKDVKKV